MALRDVKKNLKKKTEEAKRLAEQKNPTSYKGVRNVKRDAAHVAQTVDKVKGNKQPSKATGTKQQKVTYYSNKAKTAAKNTGATVRKATREATKSSGIKSLQKSTDKAIGKVAPKMSAGLDKKIENTKQRNELMRITRRTQALKNYDRYMDEKYGVKTPWPSYMSRKTPTDDEAKRLRENTEAWKSFDQWQKIAARNGDQKTVQLYEKYKKDLMADNDYINAKYANVTKRDYSFQNKTPLDVLKAEGWTNLWTGKTFPEIAKELRDTLPETERNKAVVNNAVTRIKYKTRNAGARQQALSEYDKGQNDEVRFQLGLAKQDYDRAQRKGDQAGMTAAHQRAEDIRMRYGGYSGGMTGDEYISPDVPDDIKKQLNDKGIVEWKKAQVQRNRAVTEDEIARADTRKQQILDDPNLRKYNRVKEALKYDALSIGSSAVGLAETTNAMMNEDFEKDVQKRWGDVNLQTLSARRQNAIAELEDYDRNIQTLGYDPKDRNRVVLQNELLSIEAAIDRKLNPNKYRELASVSPDSLSQRMYKSAQEHRENAVRGLGTVGRYATEAGMMVGEVLPAMALASLSGGTSLMAMGAQAAGARMNELNARGISPSESFSRSGLAGISAAATEKIPLERLGKLLKGQTGRNIVLSVLGNIGVEIGTEEADEITNTMMDFAYRDPEAEWSWDNIRDTAILTAISAGFMNVPAATVGQIVNGTAVRPRPSVRGEPRRAVSNPTDVDNTTQLQTPEIQAKTEEQANLITQAQDVQTDQRIEEARQLKTDVEAYNALAKAGVYSPEEKAQVKAMLDERFAEIAGQEIRRVEQAPPTTLEEAAMQAVNPEIFQPGETISMPEARAEVPSPVQYTQREPVQYTAKEPVQRPPAQNVVQEEANQRTLLNPQTEREVLSRNIKTFSENGQKAIMAAYQPGGDVMAYRQAFADVYDKALSGKDNIAKPTSLTQPQYYAAVQAGFNDRTISMGQTMFTVGRNKNAGIVRDEFTRNLDKDTYRMFDGLGKAAGAKIVFVDASQLDNPAADGQINGNVIMVKKNAVNPIAFVAGHELTHRIQDTGVKEYRAFRDYVISEIAKPGAVDAKIAEYAKHGARLTREKAMDEIAADYAGVLFNGSEELQKFIRDNYANKTLLQTVLDAIRKIAEALTGKERVSADEAVRLLEDALSAAAERTGRMKKVGDVTSRDNRAGLAGEGDAIDPPGRMSISSLGDALGFEARRYADGHVEFYRNGKQIKKVTAADVKKSRMGQLITIAAQNGYISESDVTKQTRYLARLTNMILETKDAQMVYEFIGSMSWSAVKDNSDKQYGMTIDFEAICKKTEAMVAAMSEAMMRKGRGLTLDEIDVLYSKVVDAGETVPCPPCYVFSRWIGLGGLLDNINSFQKEFPDTSDGTERAERRIDEIREILAEEITALQAQDKERVRLNEEAVARGEKKGKKDLTLKTLDEITNAAKKKRLEELNKQENKLITKRNKALSKLQFDKLSDSEKAKIEKELDKLNNQYTELTRQIRIMRMYSWLKDVRLSQTYKEVPNDVLFDLRAGERFADQYADTWAFRTGQGAYYGKAITPYTDARLGEIIQGVHKSANDIKIGDDNPFNGAFDATALTNKQRDELNAAYTAVKRQNLRGGVRMQSVSDFRYEYGLDYIQTFFELQAIGAAIQTYTKVVEFVDMAASTGAFVNMSLIPWGNGFRDGKLAYSSATGMDAEAAFKLQKQWDTAGTILIGVSDEHIRAAMADKNIYFIIPYHKSGGRDDVIRGMLSALGEKIEKYEDYTYVQSEKFPSSANPVLTLRNKILTANKYFELNSKEQALVEGNEILRSLYNRKFFAEDDPLYGVQLLSEDCKHIYPYEYWDTNSTYKTADINGKRYLDWCEALDVKPKFSGDADGNHDFRNDKGYWKLLIDRRMYGRNGKYNPLVHINVSGLSLNQLDRERAKEKFGTAMTDPADLRKTKSIVDAAFPEAAEGTRFSIPSDKDYKGLSKSQMKAQLKRDAGEKLTEAEFNRLYSIHKLDYRGQWAKKGLSIDDQIDAIAENGFKGGSGAINLLPASTYNVTKYQGVQTYNEYKKWEAKGDLPKGTAERYREKLGDKYGQPEFGSVVQREFAPKKGDTLLLVPEGFRENDMVAQGYKPFPYEILRITEDYQRPYSLYEKEYQDSRYSIPSDSEYLDAYYDGDEDRMQEMVDKAAYNAGYKYKAYHHTENAFTVFDINKARRGMDIQGFFFSADPEAEREYGSARYDVYLRMEKPFVVDSVEKMNAIPIKYGTYDYGVKAREWLQEQGYDSVIRDAEFFGAEADEYIVFESEQIKSSDPVTYDDDDNIIPLSERFNPNVEDIRYSVPVSSEIQPLFDEYARLLNWPNSLPSIDAYRLYSNADESRLRGMVWERDWERFNEVSEQIKQGLDNLSAQRQNKRTQTQAEWAYEKIAKDFRDNPNYYNMSKSEREAVYHYLKEDLRTELIWRNEWDNPKLLDEYQKAVDDTDKASEESVKRLLDKVISIYDREPTRNLIVFGDTYNSESPSYSIGTEGFDQAQLMRENQQLRDKLAYWKSQTKRSDRTKSNPKDVRKLAKKLASDYSTTMDTAEIAGSLQAIYDGLGKDWTYDEAYHAARFLARDMVEQASATDDSLYNEYDPMRKFLRENQLVLSPSDRAGVTDYNDWRKAQMGRMTIKHGEKSNVDQYYKDLSDLWPEFFREERESNSVDQLERIAEVLDTIYKREEVNPFGDDIDGPAEYLAAEIMQSFWDLPGVAMTYADRVAEQYDIKAERAKERQRAAVQREREKGDARLQREKERGERRLRQEQMRGAFDRDEAALLADWREAKARREERRDRDAALAKMRAAHKEKYDNALRAMREDRDARLQVQKEKYLGKEKARSQRQKEREMVARISRHARDLSAKLLRANDKKHLPDGFDAPVAQFLDSINLSSSNHKNTKRTEAFQNLRLAYRDIIDNHVADTMTIDPDLMDNIMEVEAMKDIPIQDMSLSQLEVIWRTLRAVEASITTANKAFGQQRFATIFDAADGLRQEMARGKDRGTYRGPLKSMDRLLNSTMLTPESYFHRMGYMGENIFRMLRDAQDKHITIMQEAQEYTRKAVGKEKIRKWEKEVHHFKFDGRDVELTTAQIMSLYELMKRQQAIDHITVGGFRPDVVSKGLKEHAPTAPYRLDLDQISEIVNALTDEQMRIADKLQKFMGGRLSELGNEASLAIYGYKKFNEKNYFPIKTDKNQVLTDQVKQAQSATISGRGFTKGTKPHANNALIVGNIFDVFSNHVTDMATYSAWLEAMENLQKIYNFTFRDEDRNVTGTVKQYLEKTFGKNGLEYWEKLTENLNNGVHGTNENPFNAFVGNYKASAIGANIRVFIQQPTAILRAMDQINPVDFIAGIGRGTVFNTWKKVKKYAPIAVWKDWGYFDADTGRQMKSILFGDDGAIGKFNNTMMAPAGFMDSVGWSQIWNALEAETRRTKKYLKPKSEEFYQAVAQRFNEVIDHTQVVDGILQRSQVMRDADGISKMATSFMSEPTKVYNMFTTAVYDLNHAKDPHVRAAAMKTLGRTTFALCLSFVANAAAQSIVDALRDEDKDETYWEKFFQAFLGYNGDEETTLDKVKSAFIGGNMAQSINPVTYIPWAKDIMSVVQGYNVSRMDMDSVSKFVKALSSGWKAANGEGKRTVTNALAEIFAQGSRLLGVPVFNMKRDALGIYRTVMNSQQNYRGLYELEKVLYRIDYDKNLSMFMETAYLARKNGDMEAYEAIRADMLENAPTDSEKFDKKISDLEQKDVEATEAYQTELATMSDTYATMLESNTTFNEMPTEAQDKARDTMAKYAQYKVLGDRMELDNDKMEKLDDIEAQDLPVADWVVFKTEFDTLHSIKDENGKTTKSRQEQAIELIDQTFDTKEQKCAAYRSVYDSDANNPWA